MLSISRKPVAKVLLQHVEDSAVLRNIRSSLVMSPHVKLNRLRRLDDRLAAHLDALAVSADEGWRLCMTGLERPGPAEIFVAAVRAIDDKRQDGLERLLAVCEAVGDTDGLVSAFEWLDSAALQGSVKALLVSAVPFRRAIGIAACSAHRTDFRISGGPSVRDASPTVRARALRAAGEVGLSDSADELITAMSDADPDCGFWAAWSSALIDDQARAIDTLTHVARSDDARRGRAFRLALQAMTPRVAHRFLQDLAGAPEDVPWLIQGSGIAGDPAYAPWLISNMSDEKKARAAGEAFSLITGLDLALLDLECKPPENFESGPNDDPNDPNVDMDGDDGLPWPDAQKIEEWWAANGSRFQKGTRYFMGAPVARSHCIEVLKTGYQRQRILAAHYLCLLEPGTPLFNTSAPAWRQQRWLAKM
jgi:uncharacterized protein (TIGR02270 family)